MSGATRYKRTHRDATGTPSILLEDPGIELVFGGKSDDVNMSTKGKQSGPDDYELLWETTGDTPHSKINLNKY